MPDHPTTDVDFIIIGSGIAGLTYALETAKHGRTLILTKKDRAESNSNYAQGGIAGVMSENDDFSLHKQDTLIAGAGLCHEDAVDVLVHEGPERIRDLIALGARFNTETDESGRTTLSLGREGGHSRNRIVHAVDQTGRECERTLLQAAKDNPNLQILEHFFVIDLALSDGGCIGAWALDSRDSSICLVRARATFLATGGCGQVYLHTTNPEIATGDGVAMAWRAGAPVANMEFIQFHPTALYHPEGKSFLISEAVRGEGGILRAKDGSTFMERYDDRKELAPRDIVARAIHAERLNRGDPCVYLDVTHLKPQFVQDRFPTIYGRLLELGIDITREPIPVVPAAHYQCGGVQTDLNGATAVQGLFAAGEVACTGVHGANRLASNSLLEAMVFGYRAALAAIEAEPVEARPTTASPRAPKSAHRPGARLISNLRDFLKTVMNDQVGIVRIEADLTDANEEVRGILAGAEKFAEISRPDPELFEMRNLATIAMLIVRSALTRRESRGLHYRTDYPRPAEVGRPRDTVIRKLAGE